LKAFISYSSKDKLIAGSLKKNLEERYIKSFLAHHDIKPSKEWIQEIIENIKNCDVFIALLSENFKESDWTDQEVGIALANSKLIMPVSLDGKMPYGFMGKYQVLKKFRYTITQKEGIEEISCEESAYELINLIFEQIKFSEVTKNDVIEGLGALWNFREAEKYFYMLLRLQPFTEEQINQIMKKSIENDQIHKSYVCGGLIKTLLRNYDKLIDKDIKSKIISLI